MKKGERRKGGSEGGGEGGERRKTGSGKGVEGG